MRKGPLKWLRRPGEEPTFVQIERGTGVRLMISGD